MASRELSGRLAYRAAATSSDIIERARGARESAREANAAREIGRARLVGDLATPPLGTRASRGLSSQLVSPVPAMEWSNQDVLEFLDHYESEPAVWNPFDPDYKSRAKVMDAWRRIAGKMEGKFTVNELKGKKLSLMASYRKLATKVKNNDDTWKPEWFAYQVMDKFLRDVYEPKIERRNSQVYLITNHLIHSSNSI